MNNNIIKISRLLLIAILIGICPGIASGKKFTLTDSTGKVVVYCETLADEESIRIISAKNNASRSIDLSINGKRHRIKQRDSASFGINTRNNVRFDYVGSSGEVLWRKNSAPEKSGEDKAQEPEAKKDEVKEKPQSAEKSNGKKEVEQGKKNKDKDPKQAPAASTTKDEEDIEEPSPADSRGAASAFEAALDKDPYFGKDAVYEYVQQSGSLVNGLSEADDKAQFLTNNDVEQLLIDSENELEEKRNNLQSTASDMAGKVGYTDVLSAYKMLETRLEKREQAYNKLKDAVSAVEAESEGSSVLALFSKSIINYAIIGVIALIMLILVVVAIRRKKSKSKTPRVKTPEQKQPQHDSSDNSVIVVRKRTTSMLKKQCIDDVKGNPEYMQINASEFTQDSAVRSIYIKNTCIKEVYDLYAEDLRNTGNPKEDGCMVLGRWVYDESSNSYDVTMETTVFPGDDAVFKEYELNFGGKIKLRVAEKLRKLRRDTNLQYDLVCWIHSHPGLGVFFSNSDVNVQMQLKHAQHPNFLIAFVIDILTSTQETGIFTFRHDGTVNSRGDLTKLYSLEDMYKWTLDSEQASFSPENYYNILKKSKMQMPSCRGIELNNSSIIDLSQRVLDPVTGLVGRAVGTSFDVNGSREYVVSGIARADERPSAGVIGLLLNVAHISLPTIQRLIAGERGNIAFVMVYSSRQNTVTSIPVINGELIMDEHFYGEETIEDLKIWTRRKR